MALYCPAVTTQPGAIQPVVR